MAKHDPHERLNRAHANYRDFYRALALASDRGAYEEIDGLALISSGLDLADIDLAIAMRSPADPAATLGRAESFYRRQRVPWRLVVPDTFAVTIDAVATSAGLRPDHSEPGMILAPIPPIPRPAPAGLTVHEVVDEPGLRAFTETAAAPLQTTPELFAALFHPSLLDREDLTLYLGKIDGKPVATAACIVSQDIAGIYCVATDPAHRRRGFASALTWHAAQEGLAGGCDASCLQAWPMAVNLYTRLSYRHAVTYRTWSPRSSP